MYNRYRMGGDEVMWVIVARLVGRVVEMIGPFESAQEAAKWVDSQYTPKLGTSASIEKLTSPDEAAAPQG